jgi:hypothetical protein
VKWSKQTVWLVFADQNRFAGVAIVDIGPDEIDRLKARSPYVPHLSHSPDGSAALFLAAIGKTIELGINPGDFSARGQEIPQQDYIPAEFKNRLLFDADVKRLFQAQRNKDRLGNLNVLPRALTRFRSF